jgi:hypothetical protein
MNQYIITEEGIEKVREIADRLDDLYPVSAEELRKICARIENCSHPYQSERDKVLSLIRSFIEHEGFNCGETDAIKEYMEELRQQAGEP